MCKGDGDGKKEECGKSERTWNKKERRKNEQNTKEYKGKTNTNRLLGPYEVVFVILRYLI